MWPKCLPVSATSHIESFINRAIKPVAEMRKEFKPHADMVREAKQMEKAALKLLRNLREFEKAYFVAMAENHKWEADRLLNGLDKEELSTAQIAYSQYSCQFVLLGLAARMRALQVPGRKSKDPLGRLLKEEIERVFMKLNLPTGRSNDFVQALEYAIYLSGIKASADSLVREKGSFFGQFRWKNQ